ncbi:MAG: HU family DNA-binding protein [Solirubrobacterales bacterium]|nr:HU family DNA-binding protein [Solirubrobacterales bacterium]
MTKSEFVDNVHEKMGGSKKDAEAAVDAVMETITDALKRGSDVALTGFGKFHVAHRNAREGKHPRTGAPLHIPATKVPRFTAGAKLKTAVKG